MNPSIEETPEMKKSSSWPIHWFERSEQWLYDMGAIAIGIMTSIVAFNTIAWGLFGYRIPDDVDLIGELMVFSCVLPLSYSITKKAHVSVDILTQYFNPKAQSYLETIIPLISLVGFIAFLYCSWINMSSVIESGEYYDGILELPYWPGYTAFFIGVLWGNIRLIVNLMASLKKLTPSLPLQGK